MSESNLTFTPAWKLKKLLTSKQISPTELTEIFLRKIEATDYRINSYITITPELALAQAKTSENRIMKKHSLRALEGIPISIKDLLFTKNVRTTSGSLLLKDFVPEYDSIAVERVRKAGVVIVGKTNSPEFGLSGTTENRLGEACRNPWDTSRTTGGSSGGAAAAIAAGLCSLSIGSDGGGSIRIPASFCGIYGLKPTRGRVPRHGGFGGWPLFSTVGPMTSTVKDSALLLQVLSGPDRRDTTCIQDSSPDFLGALEKGIAGLKFGWSPNLGYGPVEPEILDIVTKATQVFTSMGATISESNISLEEPFHHFWNIIGADSYAALGHFYEHNQDLLTDYVKTVLEHGMKVTGVEYSRSLSAVFQLQASMASYFKEYDLLLTPTMPVSAFSIGKNPEFIGGLKVDPSWGYLPFTYPFNMTGQPAATLPCGFTTTGLPIGLQIIGRTGDESTVLRASNAFEKSAPWSTTKPKII